MPKKSIFSRKDLAVIQYLARRGCSDGVIELITGIEKENVRYAKINILKMQQKYKSRITLNILR